MKYIRTEDGRIMESIINENRKELGYEPFEFINQADTIEELIQDDDLALWFELTVDCADCYYDYTIENAVMSVKDAKKITGGDDSYGHFKIKDIKELYIKNGQGNYIKAAQKETKEGELELL